MTQQDSPSAGIATSRVVRFSEARAYKNLFLDTVLPGHHRTNYNLLGNVGENEAAAASVPALDISMEILECDPGCGAAFHTHPTEEVFMPLSGQWRIMLGGAMEDSVTLGRWDTISVPPNIMRSFENVSDGAAHLLALGPAAGFELIWHPAVLQAAAKLGWGLDDAGKMRRITETAGGEQDGA